MELKPQLCVFILLIQVSLAVWQHMTVEKGQTVRLSCPITNAHKTSVEWKNPEGFVMFFNDNKALRDKRYSIIKLSDSEFTVSIADVNFRDGGNYTCSHYGHHSPIEKKVEVTVLSRRPRINVAKHDGKFIIKCSAEANHYPPQISFQMDDSPEIFPHAQVQRGDKKYVSESILEVQAEKRVTVKCLFRHPALHSHLINFVKIGKDAIKIHHTTTTRSPTAQPQGSTHGRTTVDFTTTDVTRPSSESSATLPIVPTKTTETFPSPSNHVTSTDSHLTNNSSTTVGNDIISNDSNTTGWTSVSGTTEETSFNSTERNTTGGSWVHFKGEGNSSLLVFLVTCLIFCLLVVVIFFAIKLRRAHIIWKRENEESNPSEESSKSKSSQEEKNSQAQRRRGLFNTAFTQYVVEEPTAVNSVINTGAMAATESVNKEPTSQPQTTSQTPAKCPAQHIKETEL